MVTKCPFSATQLKAEFYTCLQKTHDPEHVVYHRVLDGLTRPLAISFALPVLLYWKQDSPRLSHDRYLQTDNVAISFSKGFDYIEGGKLQRCKIRVDNGSDSHLSEYRSLADARPPA